MPKYDFGELDLSRVAVGIEDRYVNNVHQNHRSYYWLLLVASSGVFLFSYFLM